MRLHHASLFAVAILIGAPPVQATAPGPAKAVKTVDGKYVDAEGNPTYKISPDGTVDWYTFSGYRRFNGTCDVCHGFDGGGSSFGPDLTASLKSLNYTEFLGIVASGRQNVNTAQTLVMPAFGDNKNVMCYIDDIYVYLRARADGALKGGRPQKHEDKPPEAAAAEKECMGF
jgi:methanol metabolism-related c-type cytochrome